MAKKLKYYTVWKGRKTGVFDNWKEAEAQVKGFETAQYKSFESLKEAEDAFKGNYWQSVQKPQGAIAGKPKKSSAFKCPFNFPWYSPVKSVVVRLVIFTVKLPPVTLFFLNVKYPSLKFTVPLCCPVTFFASHSIELLEMSIFLIRAVPVAVLANTSSESAIVFKFFIVFKWIVYK